MTGPQLCAHEWRANLKLARECIADAHAHAPLYTRAFLEHARASIKRAAYWRRAYRISTGAKSHV